MRIGFDGWGLSGATLHTGMGQYSQHIVQGLAAQSGISVVIYGAPHEPRPDWLPAVASWRHPRVPGPSRTAAILSRMLTLRSAVADDKIDVFHAPATHVRPSLPPVPSLACPVVTTVHDVIPLTHYGRALPRRLRWFYRWNLHRALESTRVITVSEAARAEIMQVAPAASERITVIHNGVDFLPNGDTAPLRRLGVRTPYILYAGSHEPRKNLERAASAFAAVAAAGYPDQLVAIVDAGSGHEAGTLRHLAGLRLGHRVQLVHSLPDDDLRSLYTHASILLYPSLAEGFGMPPLQAAACGVPVVASDLPAIRETMGESAVYIDPLSEASISNGMMELLHNPAMAARLADAGRQRAKAFTWGTAVDKHVETYTAAATSGPG